MSVSRLFSPKLARVAALGQVTLGKTWPLSRKFERGKSFTYESIFFAVIGPICPSFYSSFCDLDMIF